MEKERKIDKVIQVWIVVTVYIAIFAFSSLMVAYLFYPHVASNPNLAEKIGWTPEEIQQARIKAEAVISIARIFFYIFISSLIGGLIIFWRLGYLHQ